MLSLQDIHVDLGGRTVLRRVALELNAGQTVAVVGRNGAGKTTLLRALMGVAPLRSGRIEMDGAPIQAEAAHGRTALGFGYAPEDRVILPTFTVETNLRLPCQVLRMQATAISGRLQYVLDIVPQLKNLLPRSGAGLSGGQAKMVALGRALMTGTRVVLLDEPFQGLAPVLAEQYGHALQTLRRTQPALCVVVTESNAALLRDVQSQVFHIERGVVQPLPAQPTSTLSSYPGAHGRPTYSGADHVEQQ